MSAWPGAHAGIGVDGAAPDLASAGCDGSTVRRAGHDGLSTGVARRWRNAVGVHAAAFGWPRWKSLLCLAATGRLIAGDGATCTLTRVVSRRVGWLWLGTLTVLVVVPAAVVSADPTGLSTAGQALWIAGGTTVTLAAIVAAARSFAQSRQWRVRRGAVFEVANLAAATRGRGDGGRLLDEVIREADRRGATLVLRVRPDNRVAVHLYRSRGFVDSTLRSDSVGELALERAGPAQVDVDRHVRASDVGLVALIACAIAGLVWVGHAAVVVVCVAAALGALVVAAIVDSRTGRLPNWLLATSAAFAVVACDAADVGAGAVFLAVLASASPFLAMHLLDPQALGFGDVKFALAAGTVVAVVSWRFAVLVPLLAFALAIAERMVRPRGPRAFGPALAAATSAALFAAVVLSSSEVGP